MYKNEFDDISERNDILNILTFPQDFNTAEKEEIMRLLTDRVDKLQQEISRGELTVFDRNKITQQINKLREERLRKEKDLQSPQVQRNQPFQKQLKRQIIKLKQEENMLVKEEAKLKKKLILEQVKKWQELQAEIREKKQAVDAEQMKKQIQQAKKIEKQEKQLEKKKRLQRKKEAQKKLKEIEKNRKKRQQILKFSEIQLGKLHPKYLEIEKKYKQIEDQMKFEEDLLKKNNKFSAKIDYNAIKAHQQQYMNKVEQRNRKLRQAMKNSTLSQRQQQFTPFVQRDEAKIEEQRNKYKRRLAFEKNIKAVPININPEKRKQIEIQIDRSHNPLKYHFLSEKALSKEQIYEQFPNFQVNVNPKDLGVQYLKQLPKITQNSRMIKSSSEHTLSVREPSERFKYKDYLNDLKASRPQRIQPKDEDLLRGSINEASKNKIIQKLASREKKYSMELLKRQHQLDQYNGVKSTIKKVQEMDHIYAKSIKAKLTMLQIKQ